jgi:hypothetical protein
MVQSDLVLRPQLRGLLEKLVIKWGLKKAPFANIATMLHERASTKVLMLKYPLLALPSKDKRKEIHLF